LIPKSITDATLACLAGCFASSAFSSLRHNSVLDMSSEGDLLSLWGKSDEEKTIAWRYRVYVPDCCFTLQRCKILKLSCWECKMLWSQDFSTLLRVNKSSRPTEVD
jgi:hypothetical protein